MKPMPPWTCTPRKRPPRPRPWTSLGDGDEQLLAALEALAHLGVFGDPGEVGGDRGGEAEGARGLDLRLHQAEHAADVGVVEDRRAGLAGPGRAALAAIAGVTQGLLVGALGDAHALDADAQARGVHHGEHGGKALVGLARPAPPARSRTP
jgi:hypothetical protein